MSAYQVTLEVFEGPLDLLLALVRRAELDITTVSLARVTTDYLAYLARLEEIDPGALAEFCEVAATLLLLKSRTLLPRPPDTALEADEDDPDALAARLREYRRYRDVADNLSARHQRGLRAFARVAAPVEPAPRLEPGEASVVDLAAAFEAVLAQTPSRRPEPEPPPGVRPYRYRLSDRLREIGGILLARRRIAFHELLVGDRPDREFVIVSFLAVLELLRRAAVRAVQEELFGHISIELRPETARLWEREGFRVETES